MNTEQLLNEHSRSLRLIEKNLCCLLTAINNVGLNPLGVDSYVTASTVTLDSNVYGQLNITALAEPLIIANPTGAPTEGRSIVYRIKDNGVSRALTFGANFSAYGEPFQTATTAGKTMYIGCVYNATDNKWNVFPATIEQ